MAKSTPDQIRQRFDGDVERFATLESGQTTIIDAPLLLDLIASAAATTNPDASHVLDIGCGAGNYSLKLLQHLPHLNVTLVDLSRPMLDRALERIGQATNGQITTIQADVRALRLPASHFDTVMAAAVLHHLRSDAEWEEVFAKCYAALKTGGSFWIADLVEHTIPQVQALMWRRYGEYLTGLRDKAYRDRVFAYIEQEDTPRSLGFQVAMLHKVGFRAVEILHKHNCFAAFGAVK